MKIRLQPRNIGFLALIEYFLAIFIILESRSVYTVTMDYSMPIDYAVIALTILLLVYGLAFKKIKLKRRLFLISVFLIAYTLLFFLINVIHTDSKSDFICKFVLFLPILTAISIADNKEVFIVRILKKYANIMAVLACISVFFWLFGSVLNVVSPTGTVHYYWGIERTANSYFGLYIEANKDVFLFTNLYRNNGIFTEAPMHSLNLTIALAVNLFLGNEKDRKILSFKNLILICAIISTISLTGLGVIAVAILGKKFFESGRKKGVRQLLIIILILVLVVVAQNLIDLKSSTTSFALRIDDYVAGFKAWIDNLIFGGGYGVRNYQDYVASWRGSSTGYSNALFWILSQGGIYLFFIYLLPAILSIRKYILTRNIDKIIFWVIIWYLIATATFAYQYILLLVIAFWIQDAADRNIAYREK